ncbi:DUF1033 family protein [Lysinibacillus sp. LZ02]|uniref:DUF1033 family protein n=1 Tax=Lysinibacillus sp. LZ02 TaxID=3420668 RepID=UPI003D362573
MYKIIYMKADFEPWWLFEGWESHIVSTYQYETKEEYESALKKLLAKLRAQFEHEEMRKEQFIAFWNEEDCEFCEGCDEDVQIFHGLILEAPSLNIKEMYNLQK